MDSYNFDVMLDDTPVVTVLANRTNKVACFTKLTDNLDDLPVYLYGSPGICEIEPNFEWLEKFLIARTFPRNRVNCADLLAWLGLDRYDIWEINRKTKGRSSDDPFWLRFHNEDEKE